MCRWNLFDGLINSNNGNSNCLLLSVIDSSFGTLFSNHNMCVNDSLATLKTFHFINFNRSWSTDRVIIVNLRSTMNVNIFKNYNCNLTLTKLKRGQINIELLKKLQTSFDDFSLHFLKHFLLILLMTMFCHSRHRMDFFCLWRCHKSDERWIEIDVHSCFVHRFSHFFMSQFFIVKSSKTNAKIDAFVSFSMDIVGEWNSILKNVFKMLRVMEMIVEDLNN